MSATLTLTKVEPTPREWSLAERERLVELGLIADASDPNLRFDMQQSVKLAEHGFLDGQRTQLIRGELLVMGKAGEPHSCSISLISDALRSAFGTGYYIRVQMPLVLSLETDPEPDLAVVIGSPRDYRTWPTTAVLVVEVADTTLQHDMTVKADLYASAGIPEYWILDVNTNRLIVLRDPAPIAAGGVAYRTQLTRYAGDSVSPFAMPSAVIAVSELLP
jgi:Uma2 family endonuclease